MVPSPSPVVVDVLFADRRTKRRFNNLGKVKWAVPAGKTVEELLPEIAELFWKSVRDELLEDEDDAPKVRARLVPVSPARPDGTDHKASAS